MQQMSRYILYSQSPGYKSIIQRSLWFVRLYLREPESDEGSAGTTGREKSKALDDDHAGKGLIGTVSRERFNTLDGIHGSSYL